MQQPVFFTAGTTDALRRARHQLLEWGYIVSPTPSQHVSHLLLPVPSFEQPGIIKGGGSLDAVLQQLPEDVVILGGYLTNVPRQHVDFLKDEYYLNENAAITAHCTVQMVTQEFGSLDGVRILVIGWGRIGKQLIPLLSSKGDEVCTAVRKSSDLEALQQLGNKGVFVNAWHPEQYSVIINTAPAHVLDEKQTDPDALLIDLASIKGIDGNRVIWARGLPNRDAPDLSGILIAKTALRYALGKE